MRGMAYKRNQREKHIKRKEQILRKYRLDNPPHKYNDSDVFGCISFPRGREENCEGSWLPYWVVRSRGHLDKGNIHCSCGMCMAKTRNKGRRRRIHGNYAPSINYKISDLRKVQQMDWDESHWKDDDKLFDKFELNYPDEWDYFTEKEFYELIEGLSD